MRNILKLLKCIWQLCVIYTVVSFLYLHFSEIHMHDKKWQSFQLNTMWFDMYIPLRDQDKLPSKNKSSS